MSLVNFGQTGSALDTVDSGNANQFNAQKATLSGSSGTLQTLHFYVTSRAAGAKLVLGIYASDGAGGQAGTKLAQVAEFTPSVGWNDVSTTSNPSLTPAAYWLAWQTDDATLSNPLSTSSGELNVASTATYAATLPDPAPTIDFNDAREWAFYATIDTGGGGGGGSSTQRRTLGCGLCRGLTRGLRAGG